VSALGEVVRRDLARRRRDPVGLLVQLSIPLGLLLIFWLAFGSAGDERTPRARLLVVDADSSFVSRFVTGAFSQGGLSKMVDTQAADSASAMRLLRREKASGALFIPRGFGADFLAARPTRLALYKNPSERILPSILEEILATMVDGGGAAQALLAEPMRRMSGMQSAGSAPPESAVAGVSVAIQRAITRSGKYLLPPVIELKTEAPAGKKGPSFMELFFPGLVFMGVVFLSQSIALDTGEERRRGTLRRSLAMGVSPWHLFLGKVLAGLAVVVPAMGLVFFLGHWFIATPVMRLLAGWALISATAFAALTILFFLALLPKSPRAAQVLSSMVVLPLLMLGGGFFPSEVMPAALRAVAVRLPSGWAVERLKDVLQAREGASGVLLPAIGACVVVGMVFLFAAQRLAPRRFAESEAMVRQTWFLAWHDVRVFLRSRSNLMWMFLMPPFFMWVTGMAAGGDHRPAGKPLVVIRAAQPGPVMRALAQRLEALRYDVRILPPGGEPVPAAVGLTAPDDFEARVLAGEKTPLMLRAGGDDDLSLQLNEARVRRAVIRTLGDLAVLATTDSGLTDAGFSRLAARPPAVALDVKLAFPAPRVPSGMRQSVPGMLVMFILMVLVTGGTERLFVDRKEGLLRRLASSPLTRGEIVLSRILSRTILGLFMSCFALVVGALLFGIDWGPQWPFLMVVLAAYALAASGLSVLLSTLARSIGQAIGLGVVATILMAALGGCWWPIEVVPHSMQVLSLCLPTGWAMQGMHRAMELSRGLSAALPSIAALAGFALVFGALAARRFKFD
jgi:ABC-2 type transport system permease protein